MVSLLGQGDGDLEWGSCCGLSRDVEGFVLMILLLIEEDERR